MRLGAGWIVAEPLWPDPWPRHVGRPADARRGLYLVSRRPRQRGREAGWEDPAALRFYHPPRVVRAGREELCMVMEPVQQGLWPQHVDQAAQVRRGACR